MRVVLFTFLLFILTTSLLAREINGEITIGQKALPTQGDMVRLNLKMWPFQEDQMLNKKILGTKFLNLFYISKVLSVSSSPNNREVLIAELEAVLLKPFDPSGVLLWPWGEDTLAVSFAGLNRPINKFGGLQKKFIIQNINYNVIEPKHLLLFIVPLLLVLTLFLFKKRPAKLESKKDILKQQEETRNRLLNVETRGDVELVWKDRSEIVETLELDDKKSSEVMSMIYKYQYMERWSNERLKAVVDNVRELGKQ